LYTVTVETTFNAQHQLTFANGQIETLHNHNWSLRAAVSNPNLDESGLAIDFIDLKAKIDDIIAPFNNVNLENLPQFGQAGKNASAENIARYIFDSLMTLIQKPLKLLYVEVMEAPKCWAKYSQ